MNIIISWFCKIFLAPLIKKFFIKEIKGLENIPKINFIVVSNHQSHLDELITSYICVPRKYRFIGQVDSYGGFKKLLLYFLYFLGDVIHLNRKSKESRKSVLEEAIRSLNKGYCLIMYPEGTRSRTGEIQEARWGVARILLKTKAPILPVGIKGMFDVLPPHGKLNIKKIVEVGIGNPLFFEEEREKAKGLDENSEEYKEILQKITQETMKQIVVLSGQGINGKD